MFTSLVICVPWSVAGWGMKLNKAAIADKRLQLVGPSALTRNIQHWIADSIFAGIAPAGEI